MTTAVESARPSEAGARANDYSLVGENSRLAVEHGLAEADWYQSPVPRETLRDLLQRRDGPAVRDTIIWFGLLILSGVLGGMWWGNWYAIFPFAVYGVIYGTTSDSRWHEAGHGTAFKTDWMNNALYEIACFMVMREPNVWRWSHTRHHSDTIIVGRDPEIAVPRPANLRNFLLGFVGWGSTIGYFKKLRLHVMGRLEPDERTFVPESDYPRVFFKARVHALIYAVAVGAAVYTRSILPLMYIGLPSFYGAWLMRVYGYTQHAGLAEDVLDHRLNTRTVYMNWLNRYLYWNMNYHVEHHMYPLVPYHNLPRLHEIVKGDMPTPYASIAAAFREIIPAVLRQTKDPAYYVKRALPTPSVRAVANVAAKTIASTGVADDDGWVDVGSADVLDREDVLRFDHGQHTFAVYRTAEDQYCATDGMCTHGNTHLATGLVSGNEIECPKHNGRFDVRDGSPRRRPVCVALGAYPVRVENGVIQVNLLREGAAATETTYTFRVVSNDNVATFIKELVVEPADGSPPLDYLPGQYLHVNVPAYGTISFDSFDVTAPYDEVWRVQHVYDYKAENHTELRRNFSLACRPGTDSALRFNVRISTPPRGQECNAGLGTTYLWNLKPGDVLTAVGPFGDFLVKESEAEMIYLGGGAGMASLRAHLEYLFETLKTGRKVGYWYGARSRQEMFYEEYFEQLAAQFDNFSFHVALSEPLPEDNWTSLTGNIHDVLRREYLATHPDPASIEYYLCGPQPMIQAARQMLEQMGVGSGQIAFDEF